MNILVVGGAGYVGGAFTDLMMQSNHNFKVFDALLYEEDYRKPVPFVHGDVRDKRKLLKELAWADCVVWLAGLVGDGACALNSDITFEINQESIKWLAEIYDKRIVYPSSCSVYGASEDMLTEESPVNPLSIYASTKIESENYLKNKDAIILRFGTLFGVGDSYSRVRLDLVVNTMTARAIQHGRLKVFGGEQYRPLLHVKTAAKALYNCLESSAIGIYNLATENMKILDLAYEVQENIQRTEIDIVEMKFEDARNYKVDFSKAELKFPHIPKFGVVDGINEIKGLILDGRIKDLNNPRYSNASYLTTFNTHEWRVNV